ncbi:hypothetical protein EJ419_02485 [Alloscardovia theropitheci]|uniref:Uncharacterized protein n=1 Tax=Alloscardovia theropitheci TaxID=2496842 RepID=A0A4R0QYC3_9BIFI|nr:hypothetical protein [Alloscardovia theropitheci]TCD54591.1 hypothetical protein EJ419_02485 [Alloscardovia theropitheci]
MSEQSCIDQRLTCSGEDAVYFLKHFGIYDSQGLHSIAVSTDIATESLRERIHTCMRSLDDEQDELDSRYRSVIQNYEL